MDILNEDFADEEQVIARNRMALSIKYLSDLVGGGFFLPNSDKKQEKGGLRWKGPHLLVCIRYVLKLRSYYDHHRFSDLLRMLEVSAHNIHNHTTYLTLTDLYFGQSRLMACKKFLQIMENSFLPELAEFFAVTKPQKYLSDSTPNGNELVASFIDFLIETIETFSGQKYISSSFTDGINPLVRNLKFLLIILGDTPLSCTELEETKNVMAKIESVANEAGSFLHSFFFTADVVKEGVILAALRGFLPKFKMVEEEIEKHCITFSKQLPSIATSNTDLVSVFIVDLVLDYLNHLVNDEAMASLVVDVKDQITTLHEELQLSRSFLGDIDIGSQQNKEVVGYAIQLSNLGYEAEYILNWFEAGEVPVWYLTHRLSNFIIKNKHITSLLQEIKLICGVNRPQAVQGSHEVAKGTLIDDIIVGLKDETMQIANQLVGGPDHLQMISITGMPGLGKTTLAKKLYNHSSIVNHFDQRLWCVVSQTYQRTRLLIEILCSMTKRKDDEFLDMEDYELGDYLHKNLKKRRYLIVMDDIWNIQAWNDVKIYFPKDNTRSRVLFTTRNRNLASEASSDAIMNELSLLSADQCWDLLQQKVFRKYFCPPKLEQIGKQIAASCKGLPLAVVGIAAVLAHMDNNESSWQQVSQSLTSYISKDQDILELSYKHLPIHLKPCFLYFSAFEEDREIPVKKLLSLWISEGFIRQNRDKRSEDVAKEYLIELINRSMVQVAKRTSDNGVKACNVHDLIHDVALRIAKQEKFLKVIEDTGFSIYEQHHRLCNLLYPHIESRLFGMHVRTLLDIPGSSFIVSRSRLLRVLQFSDTDKDNYVDNREFLFHPRSRVLRFSDTGKDNYIKNLEFLAQLRYLEIPSSSLQMSVRLGNLEYLILRGYSDSFPDLSNMPKLRHLVFKGYSRLSKDQNIEQAYTGLETLSGFRIFDSRDEQILKCFPHLRRLKCLYGVSSSRCPNLSFLPHLESLSMIHQNNGVRFRVNNFSTNIKKLSLSGGFHFEIMSSVAKFPNLEILKLDNLHFERENWNTNANEFQKLKYLKLTSVYLRDWNTSEDHFPILERLVLESCDYLNGIPLELGYILALKMIEVHSCGASVRKSAMNIKEEQVDNGNELLNVIIYGLE